MYLLHKLLTSYRLYIDLTALLENYQFLCKLLIVFNLNSLLIKCINRTKDTVSAITFNANADRGACWLGWDVVVEVYVAIC